MTPKQIGALAEHVSAVVAKNKDSFLSRSFGEQEWEQELADLVNEDKRLPDYNVIDNVVLEFLLSHYESEVHAIHETWENNDADESGGPEGPE